MTETKRVERDGEIDMDVEMEIVIDILLVFPFGTINFRVFVHHH